MWQIERALDEAVDLMIINYPDSNDLTADRLLDKIQRSVSNHGGIQWETATMIWRCGKHAGGCVTMVMDTFKREMV